MRMTTTPKKAFSAAPDHLYIADDINDPLIDIIIKDKDHLNNDATIHAIKSTYGYLQTQLRLDGTGIIASVDVADIYNVKLSSLLCSNTPIIDTRNNRAGIALVGRLNGSTRTIGTFTSYGRPSTEQYLDEFVKALKTPLEDMATPFVYSGKYGFWISNFSSQMLNKLLALVIRGDGTIIDYSWISLLVAELERRTILSEEASKKLKVKKASPYIKNQSYGELAPEPSPWKDEAQDHVDPLENTIENWIMADHGSIKSSF